MNNFLTEAVLYVQKITSERQKLICAKFQAPFGKTLDGGRVVIWLSFNSF